MKRAERLARLLILLVAVGSLPHPRALPQGRAVACAPCTGQHAVRLEALVGARQPVAALHEGASTALPALTRVSQAPAGLLTHGTRLPHPGGMSRLRGVPPAARAGLARSSSAVRGPPFLR